MALRDRYLTSALVTALVLPGSSQPTTAHFPGTPPVAVRFACYATRLPPGELRFVARPGAPPTMVVLYAAAPSERYEYVGPLPMLFNVHDPVGVTGTAAEPTPRTIAVPLEPAQRDVLLVFEPPRQGARASWRVLVLDQTPAAFPPGHVRVLNLSGRPLQGSIAGTSRDLPDGGTVRFAAAGEVALELRGQHGLRFWTAYRGEVPVQPDGRATIIVLPPDHPGSPEVGVRTLLHGVESRPGPAP